MGPVANLLQHRGCHPAASWGALGPCRGDAGAGAAPQPSPLHTHCPGAPLQPAKSGAGRGVTHLGCPPDACPQLAGASCHQNLLLKGDVTSPGATSPGRTGCRGGTEQVWSQGCCWDPAPTQKCSAAVKIRWDLGTKRGMEGLPAQAGSFKPQPACLYTGTCIKKMRSI